MGNKVVLLMSGGYDSTVCLSLLTSLGYEGTCLFFDYGQMSVAKERERAFENTAIYGKGKFDFKEVTIGTDWLFHHEVDGYFPSRNVVFFSYALSYAESKGMNGIVFGIFKSPTIYSYPDCTPEFIINCNAIASSVGIEVTCPLYNVSGKNDVYTLGKKLGVEFFDTWSCDDPKEDGSPCGVCGACRDIAEGIKAKLI